MPWETLKDEEGNVTPNMDNPVGRAIKSTREAQGVTQVELAKMIGVSQPRLSAMERGPAIPHIEQIAAIEEALDVSPGYVLKAAGLVAPTDGDSSGIDLVEVSARLQDSIKALEGLARALGLRADSADRHAEGRTRQQGRKRKATQ